MADEDQLKILRRGVTAWNGWREKHPGVLHPDLSEVRLFEVDLEGVSLHGADLRRADLRGASLHGASLRGANLYRTSLHGADLIAADLEGADLIEAILCEAQLHGADLRGAKLYGADLRGAKFHGADLRGADLSGADLRGADLSGADLRKADLHEANLTESILRVAILTGANLTGAQLIKTDLRNATLTGSSVYGVSVWDIRVDDRTEQQNLNIAGSRESSLTVDKIKVAQFIYLLLNNQEIREVIDTITSKAVLILGRFSEKRKPLLDALREELRKHDYLPILFDFQPSANQRTIETVTTLARMARFVIADLTDPSSVLQELQAFVPDLPSVAVRLLLKKSEHEYGMLDLFRRYPWVIEGAYEYENVEEAVASIQENIIAPAEAKVEELRRLIRPAAR
jgi:uncharacterized protein YjbI with pentapeptide repeats